MPTIKRLRTPLIVMSGVLMSVAAIAGPASAAENPYGSPISEPQVLGTTVTAQAPTTVAGVSASAGTTGLAFTGTSALGIGALGGLLLVGGATMVVAGKRRKVND